MSAVLVGTAVLTSAAFLSCVGMISVSAMKERTAAKKQNTTTASEQQTATSAPSTTAQPTTPASSMHEALGKSIGFIQDPVRRKLLKDRYTASSTTPDATLAADVSAQLELQMGIMLSELINAKPFRDRIQNLLPGVQGVNNTDPSKIFEMFLDIMKDVRNAKRLEYKDVREGCERRHSKAQCDTKRNSLGFGPGVTGAAYRQKLIAYRNY